MKKYLIICLFLSNCFAESLFTKTYNINGKVFNYTKYSSHVRVVLNDERLGRITLKLNENFKTNDKKVLKGYCFKYDFGMYENCSLIQE